MSADDYYTGKVAKVLAGFGFITPEAGGKDIYFNEHLLGDGKTWADFSEQVDQYGVGQARVTYQVSQYKGKDQATGVVVLTSDDVTDLDDDGDGEISPAEMEDFVKDHPELNDASMTKRQRAYKAAKENYDEEEEQDAEMVKQRNALYEKQDAAEEELYKKRDAENALAQQCWKESQELWDAGEHDKSKEKQAESKAHTAQARKYKAQAVALDWKNNEEMFEYVQTNEHSDREQDGTWIDLHGLSVDFAVSKTTDFLLDAKEKKTAGSLSDPVQVIYGAGHHSGRGGPQIKPAILKLLGEPPAGLTGVTYEIGTVGSCTVTLP